MPRPRERMEERMSSWFKHLRESEKAMRGERNRPFVTISRECGAYGTTVADMLAEYLRTHERRREATWAIFDKELIERVMQEHNFPTKFASYFVESPVPLIEDILAELFGLHPPQETLVRSMSETILHLATLGYVIYVGRGANIITRKLPNGVHVRLIGSFENRVVHTKEYLSLREKEAREYVTREDQDRRAYIRRYFHRDITDVSLYDLIINMDTVALQDAVMIIGDMVLGSQMKDVGSFERKPISVRTVSEISNVY
jgi:hypothetical protein